MNTMYLPFLLVLALLLSGCMEINRTAAKLAGCQGDIYATPPTCTAPTTGGSK